MKWCKRWTAVFQMHKRDIYAGHNTKDADHWQWLQRKHFKPIYMQEIDPLIPDSVRFPLEDAMELTGEDYFASTFAYMASLALLQGYEYVEIHGVEMSNSEYQYQAECWRYWLGVLKGRLGGENVIMHSAQNLLQSARYGYEGNLAFGAEHFAERAKILDAEWTAAEKHVLNMKKVIDRIIERDDYRKLPEMVKEYHTAMQTCGELAGALAEAERYQTFGDRFADRGGFEYAAASGQRDGEEKRILMFTKVGLIEYLANAWEQSNKTEQQAFHKQAAGQLIQHINIYGKLSEETGALLGKYRENIAYILKYDEMIQAHGGLKKELVTA